MDKFLDVLSNEMGAAFERAGYAKELGKVTISNRPDLCEYQCNGAMAGAKQFHKAPMVIAQDVVKELEGSQVFETVDFVAPGFLNLKVSGELLKNYLNEMAADDKFGVSAPAKVRTIMIDYGGPNVAKPLHV
ncbi:MAG: arginine--tRNA ligase, partial [Lachnospiraceae bacterium]|nr:arginine--tRNA ligase [Lachnospiraceae bacterium]